MEFILDANILFSALIKDSHIRHFLLFSNLSFYISEFTLEEINEHIEIIKEKTGLSASEIKDILDYIIAYSNIKIIPLEDFKDYIKQAKTICPDPDDIMYFALALKLKCPIWSNDKKLKNQNIVEIYSTKQLLKI
ncbi:hypothetical protein J4427_02690 [Candidatus Woesearchaeota archaeon]|nr:hypothetical protein [Candidatus Woesearchaeota archaeon]